MSKPSQRQRREEIKARARKKTPTTKFETFGHISAGARGRVLKFSQDGPSGWSVRP